ncbi:MAG: hypothetical protein Q9195_001156 [Heterodermia aff. obscurata]
MTMPNKGPDKAQHYLNLLDAARCNARWGEIPELARKVEKHAPRRNCLALTARTECQVASTSLKKPSTAPASLATNSLSGQIPALLTAIDNEKTFLEDALEAQVCLGWIHWSIGEPSLALSRIPSDISHKRERLAEEGRPLSGWTHVCIIKGAYIRGISQEQTGKFRAAVETYNSILFQISNVNATVGNSPEHRLWAERLLSRYCALSAEYVKSKSQALDELLSPASPIPASSILPPFRAWAKLLASEPDYGPKGSLSNEPGQPRRWIWQRYHNTLSTLLKYRTSYESKHRTESAKNMTAAFDHRFLFDSKLAQYAELKRVEVAYESLLLGQVGFPKANTANIEVESWVDEVMSNWLLLTGSDWEDENLEKGGKVAVSQRVQALLYRATTRSFHSTKILRHLFTLHTALAEFELAGKALDSYLEIVARGKARVEKSGEPETGLDDDSTVLFTAATGIRILCVYGGRKEAKRSLEIAGLIDDWLGKYRTGSVRQPVESADDVPHDLVDQPNRSSAPVSDSSVAAAHRALGVSRVRWSRLTYKPSERAELLDQAISDFQTASEPGLAQASDIETLYYLALAQAEKRDLDASIESVKSAISAATTELEGPSDDDSTDGQDDPPLKPSPWKRALLFKSWHLLSLLLTAKQKFDSAVRSCEAALELYGGNSTLYGCPKPNGLLGTLGLFERIGIAELKMTQLALVEVIDGPEEAVNASGELLHLYAKLFQHTESPAAKMPPVSTVLPLESTTTAPKGLRASVFGRTHAFGSSNRKSQLVMGTTGSDSTDSQVSPPGTQAAPTIQVTSDGIRSPPQESHHHNFFHHESKKLHKRDSRKSIGTVRKDRTSSPPRLSTAKSNKQPNLNLPSRSRPSTANSSNQKSTDSDPYASNEVGIAVSYNGSSANNGPPAGLDGASAVGALPPTSHKDSRAPPHSFPKPSTNQDLDSSPIFINPPPPVPEPIFNQIDTKRHSLTLLVKIWCLMAALYRRASMATDAAACLVEAETYVRSIENLVVKENGSSNETLTAPGWGGAKAVAELRADILAEKAMLHLFKAETKAATEVYEKALLWWPDHPSSTVGLCNLLLDIYSASQPQLESPPTFPELTLQINLGNFPPDPNAPLAPTKTKKIDSTEFLAHLAARDRAYGLLSALTKSGQGWDCSEAWMALARAYELSGQADKAKEALWWVVELEESRGIREWDVAGGW